MPEFGTNAALQIANSFNQFLGLQGSIDLNTIEQLEMVESLTHSLNKSLQV